jgi:hypothetical protein
MRHINSIKLDNHSELKKEMILNWYELNNYNCARLNNPLEIRIFDLLDVKTNFVELEKAKEYLKQFDLNAFQIVVYLPYSKTGFHIDGFINRYVLPIATTNDAINFELDETYLSNREYVNSFYQEQISWNGGLTTKPTNYQEWLYTPNKNNFVYGISENECIEIGDNWHAHHNYSPLHRIVIVFDTKNKINE